MEEGQEFEVLKGSIASTKIAFGAVWDDITELRTRVNKLEAELNSHKVSEFAHKV